MKLKKVLSLILAVTMLLSFFPGDIFSTHAQATTTETVYELGYTWIFDKTVEAFGKTNEFKTVYYGNEANTLGIVNHEGYGSAWGENTSRSLKNGLLTSVMTAGWDEEGHGVYYKLPAELVAGKTYRVRMNLHAAQENTPMTNDKSSHITVSFNSEVNSTQEWRIANLEAYHNAGAKFSIPAPTNLSTQSDNAVSFEFVATQEIVEAGSWMLITFPMEDGKTYILGDTSIKTVSYNYADGYTWQFDKTIGFTTDNAHKVMQYGNVANTVGIVSHSAYANYGARSLRNGILTTNITSSWAKGANGLYYKLPVGLVAGQEYVVSMNLYASAEATALLNSDSTSIKLSFANEIPAEVTDKVDQYWTAKQIEGIHNTDTLLTYRAPDYLSTDIANELAVTFVATQTMADNDGWMLISMPLAVNGEVNLGDVTLKEKNTDNHFLNGDFSDGLIGWMTNHDSSYISVQDSVLHVSDKVPTGDVKLYQAMYLEAGVYCLSFDVLGAPASWRPVYFMGTALDNSSVTGAQLQVSKESGKTEGDWWTVTRNVAIETAGTYYFQMNLNQVSDGASVAPKMQYDNFTFCKGVKVTTDLSNAKLSADIQAVVLGQSYVNTVTAIPGYAISKVTITMGGTEMTDAYNPETGKISIAAVTAEVHIQVETVEDETANLILNGNFDQGSTGWANNDVAPVATVADGVMTLPAEKTASGDARTYYAMQLKPGNYKLSFKVKGTPQQYRPLISVGKNYWSNDYGQYLMYKYNISNTAWTTVTEYFAVPESAADQNTGLAPVCITIWNSSASFAPVKPMYFDDFELYKSSRVIVQKPEENKKTPKPAVIGSRPNPSPYNDYPYICDEENNLMPNFGFESQINVLENTYSKIVTDENAWEGNHSLHYAPIMTGNEEENLLVNGDFATWDKVKKTISDWQFNNKKKLDKLEFVELDGRNAVKLLQCSENENFNLELTQRVYLEADFTYTFSFDFYGVAHWGPNLVIYDGNMKHISTMNAKTTGTEGQWTTLSTTYRPTKSGYYVFAVRIHNAAYPQKEQYISNCSVTLKSTRVEHELVNLKPNTNYWLTLFVKASEVASVENSFITFGMTVPQTGNFIVMEDPASESGRPYKTGQQLVPMAYDGQWHILTVPFNTKELTALNFTIDGLNCDVWFDNIYIFEEANAKTFQAPTTAKGEAVVTDSNPKLLGCEENKNLFENYNLNDGDAFWGDDIRKFGVFGNTVKVADSGSRVYGNALHYVSDRPNDTYYIKWVDVEPHTEYTFSAKYAIAKPGEGYMGLINGYRMESEVTENRLFPTMIQRFDFGEENYLESLAWQTAAVTFNSGERNRIGFVICDAGGEVYIDELRLFKVSDGIALEDVEDTLHSGQNSADMSAQPEKPGVIAVVLWAAGGVLLAAVTVSLIIIQKKRKNKQ